MSRSSDGVRSLMAVRGKDGGFDDLLSLIRKDRRIKVLEGDSAYDVGSTIMKRTIDLLILGSSLEAKELKAISGDVKRLDPSLRVMILLETPSPARGFKEAGDDSKTGHTWKKYEP